MFLCKEQRKYKMAHLTTDLLELYKTYFQKPFTIEPKIEQDYYGTRFDASYKENMKGVDVFLPIHLTNHDYEIDIACATIRVQGQKTIIRTAVSERSGTVKEMFNIGDYKFSIKGVLISQDRTKVMPDDDMYTLRQLFESTEPVELKNALADLFMDNNRNIVITDLEFPDVEGKELRVRPFTMECETDSVTDLVQKV